MSPSHLPDWSFVFNERSDECLLSIEDVEDFDATIRRTCGEPRAVKVHLGVVNHVLVARVHSVDHGHHFGIFQKLFVQTKMEIKISVTALLKECNSMTRK